MEQLVIAFLAGLLIGGISGSVVTMLICLKRLLDNVTGQVTTAVRRLAESAEKLRSEP